MFFKFAYVPVIVFLYMCPIESQAAAYISPARTYDVRAREVIATYVCMRAQRCFSPARTYVRAREVTATYVCARKCLESVVRFGFCCQKRENLSILLSALDSVVKNDLWYFK